jgi:hypothetical protein
VLEDNKKFKNLLADGYEVRLFFLIATKNALTYIEDLLEKYMQQHQGLTVQVECIQTLDEDAKFTNHQEQEARQMLDIIARKRYINESKLTDAYKESYDDDAEKRYHLGYKQCALTVVLNHNTPNNSLPIIWQPKREDKAQPLYPLFYRITRH